MKKVFLFFLGLILSLLTFGQQVAKNYVVVETCTEDGCGYCPYAQGGLQYLMDNGYNVIPLHYHYSGSVGNSYGNARMNYYNISGFPTSYFNGGNEQVGGYSGTNSDYVTAYNQEISKMSSFKCNVLSTFTSNEIDYTVKIRVEKVADYSGTVKLITAVTENQAPHNWEGLTYVNYLQRTMVPDNNGTALSMNTGDVDTIELNFSINAAWNTDSLFFVAFVQNMGNKEVLQADRKSMSVPAGTNNVILQTIADPNDGDVICETAIYPTITFKNKGTDTLKSCDFIVKINDDILDTVHWTGSMIFSEQKELTLDLVSYNQQDTNTLVVTAVNPNGVVDDYPDNNVASIDFFKSDETSTRIFLSMNTGQWGGSEISYALFDENGVKIDSNVSYSDFQDVVDTFNLDLNKCYYFELYDSYGNGFNNNTGYLKLTDKNSGLVLLNVEGDFGHEADFSFRPVEVAGIDDLTNIGVNIYPIPASNFINIDLKDVGNYSITIFDIDGKVVSRSKMNNAKTTNIDVQNLISGVYFIQISGSKLNVSQKIIIK